MCRWIAYRGETTSLDRYVTEPSHSLVVQSLKALESAILYTDKQPDDLPP